jgi:hypothetical protein
VIDGQGLESDPMALELQGEEIHVAQKCTCISMRASRKHIV